MGRGAAVHPLAASRAADTATKEIDVDVTHLWHR